MTFAAWMKAPDGGNRRVSCNKASIVAESADPFAGAEAVGADDAAGAEDVVDTGIATGGATGATSTGAAAAVGVAGAAGAAGRSGADGAAAVAASDTRAEAPASLARSGREPRLNHENSLDMPVSPFETRPNAHDWHTV